MKNFFFHENIFVNVFRNDKRYSRGSFQKAYSLSSWNHLSAHDKLYRKRYETNSLKLKIIQHCKQISMNTPESPTDEMFRTPNTTLDADDSAIDNYSTPIGDFSMMKMKSMTNLLDEVEMMHSDNLARMKSLSELEKENSDTPVDLIKLKRDFEVKRFNDAKMQSMSNLANGFDDNDGMIIKRHHSDNDPSPEMTRHSLQTPKIYKRVGNTKYVGGESVDDKNYQLMKMQSMGTINDLVNNNMRTSKSFDPFWNANRGGAGKKYDKTYVVPIRLDDKLAETNGNCDKNDDVFRVPENNPMLALRKEKSSSCIESMRNRGTSLYDRLR